MIRFERVTKRYPNGRVALSELSLEVAEGEMVFLTGRSGAGKSTVLKLIALLERPSRGQVWVNGERLSEPYVPDMYRDNRSMAEIVVPEGTYFMMGDHRSISSDSREFGPVERSLIYGKAVFVYWPTQDAGVVR